VNSPGTTVGEVMGELLRMVDEGLLEMGVDGTGEAVRPWIIVFYTRWTRLHAATGQTNVRVAPSDPVCGW
jgi:hypothetical protein